MSPLAFYQSNQLQKGSGWEKRSLNGLMKYDIDKSTAIKFVLLDFIQS